MSGSASPSAAPRILIVTGTFLPVVGGLEVATHRLAERLIRRDVTVKLVTARRDPHWPAQEVLPSGLHVTRLRQERVRWLGTLLYMIRLSWFLWTNRGAYDLVHSCFIDPSTLVAAFMKRLTGKPVVVRLSGGDFTGDIQRLERDPLHGIVWPMLRTVDCFVALSQRMVAELERNGIHAERIARIPNGVDTESFHPPSVEQRQAARGSFNVAGSSLVLLYVGRLSPEKGPRELWVAFQTMHSQVPDALLWLVGDGPLRSELEVEAHRAGLDDKVRFFGNVPDVRRYLFACDLFILPSHSEGMPNSLLEAMACGLPCLATRVSGTEDIVEDGVSGRLVPPKDAAALCGQIVELARQNDHGHALGAAARSRIESKFSLDQVATEYLQTYGKCLGRGTQRP